MVVLSHVNNQSGVVQPVEDFAQKLKKLNPNVKVHIDATQSFSKINFNLSGQGIDYVTISSHKLGGPKGIAGVFIKKGSNIKPLMYGGGQEKNLRSSTQSYPLLSSFTRAVQEGMDSLESDFQRIKSLGEKIRENLKRNIPGVIFPFLNSEKNRVSPYILTFVLPGFEDIILRHME